MNFFKIFSLNSLNIVQINKSKRKFGKKIFTKKYTKIMLHIVYIFHLNRSNNMNISFKDAFWLVSVPANSRKFKFQIFDFKKKVLGFFKKIENSKYLFYFISNITSNLLHKRTLFFLLIIYFF